MKLMRTVKVRLLPTERQEQQFYEFANACRFIWNQVLEWQIMHYTNMKYISQKIVNQSYSSFGKLLTKMKKTEEFNWLNNISRHTLSQMLRDQKNAYKRLFKEQDEGHFETATRYIKICKKENRYAKKQERKWHPQFKRKKDKSYVFPFDANEVYFTRINGVLHIQMPKIGKVLVKTNYNMPIGCCMNANGHVNYIRNPRVKMVGKKWILFCVITIDSQDVKLHNDTVVGIDLNVRNLAAVTHSRENDMPKVYENINLTNKRLQKLEKRYKHLRRAFDRKRRSNKEYSKNMTKNLDKMRKISYILHNLYRCIQTSGNIRFRLTVRKKNY